MEENTEGSGWKTLKRLFSFEGIRCCGSIWGRSGNNSNRLTLSDGEDEEQYSDLYQHSQEIIGTALIARDERGFRAAAAGGGGGGALAATSGAGQHPKVSLMRLLEEREERESRDESYDDEAAEEEGEGEGGSNYCCVCMGRRKGAAFIPCGHTFCRTCARELSTSRRSCPLCNRLILDTLDIF